MRVVSAPVFSLIPAPILACIALAFFCACPKPESPSISILYPDSGAVFAEGSQVLLCADAPGIWTSSLDGELGRAMSLQLSTLQAGSHEISLKSLGDSEASTSIMLRVDPPAHVPGLTTILAPTGSTATALLAAGSYLPVFYSADSQSVQLKIDCDPPIVGQNESRLNLRGSKEAIVTDGPPLDPALILPPGLGRAWAGMAGREGLASWGLGNAQSDSLQALGQAPALVLGDQGAFRMADPEKGTGEPGFLVNAQLVAVLEGADVWVDTEGNADQAALEEFLSICRSIALPRALALFGRVPGLTDESKLTILLSSKLNAGGLAVGFFNPCDFFPVCDDADSPGYNPTSNGRSMVYLGAPESLQPAFSPASLCATIAHEYQHLSRFYRKTFLRILTGNAAPPQEESAFDEAVSHFTESLCGFGLSGGNLLFVERYLEKPQAYSLRYLDADGRSDSVGKRGGGALFFDYLFRRAGGAAWSGEGGLRLVDGGGLNFILRSQASEDLGWDFISDYFGKPGSELFSDFVLDLNLSLKLRAARETVYDGLTGEPLGIDPYLGRLECPAWSVNLQGPARGKLGGDFDLGPWSAAFYQAQNFLEKTRLEVNLRPNGLSSSVRGAFLAIEMEE